MFLSQIYTVENVGYGREKIFKTRPNLGYYSVSENAWLIFLHLYTYKNSCPDYIFSYLRPIWLILHRQSAFGQRVCSDIEQSF